jgi:hypothetical protein
MNSSAVPTTGLFGQLSSRLSETGVASTLDRAGVKYVIYALLGAVIVAVVLLLADYFHPFLPFSVVSGPSASARAGKSFWTSIPADAENLMVPADAAPTKQPDVWTVSFQMIIADSRTPAIGRFRHVLHRGANPCELSAPATGAGATGHAGIQPSDLPANTDPGYRTDGLPPIMNPGFMLDRYKNDLHVFIHTRGTEASNQVLWLESATIEDLPINQALTVGAVCNGRTLELYLNCRLYSTTLLRGRPYLPPTEGQWFGRYCAYPFAGLVKNLQLWGDALNSSDVIATCGSSPSFGSDLMPTVCSSAPPPNSSRP